MIAPEDRVLDRVKYHPETNRSYGFADVRSIDVPIKAKYWVPGPILDQGREGACVAFADSGELSSSPTRVKSVDDAFALSLYQDVRATDRAMGNNFSSGASTNAGAKTLQAKGYITEYRWAFSVEEIRAALITEGPVIIGIEWRDGMYYTKPNGLVDISGPVVGGHEILLNGYTPRRKLAGDSVYRELFRWRNSWGADYGLNGHGFITAEDLATLMSRDGEAVIPMGRRFL